MVGIIKLMLGFNNNLQQVAVTMSKEVSEVFLI